MGRTLLAIWDEGIGNVYQLDEAVWIKKEIFQSNAYSGNGWILLLFQDVSDLKEGISHLHCMSDDYLAEDLQKEYLTKLPDGEMA